MAVDSVAAHGPSRGIDADGYWRNYAAARLGVTPDRLDFHRHSIASFGVGGGPAGQLAGANATTTAPAAKKGLRVTTNVAGDSGRRIDMNLTISAAQPKIIATGATEKFWMAGELDLETAIGAGSRIGFGSRQETGAQITHEFFFGVDGATSTANWVATGTAGSAIDSGVAIATGIKVLEAWRDGSVTRLRVGSTAAVSGTAAPNADGVPTLLVYENTTTPRAAVMSWLAWAIVLP